MADVNSKTDLLSIDRLQRTLTHRINMATIITGTICNIRRSIDDWRVIGTRFDGLVYKYVVRQKH